MIVTALKSFDHDNHKVRRGDQLNITSTLARSLRERGLVTYGGAAEAPLAQSTGGLSSASPAAQVAQQATSNESADGDSEKPRRKRKRPAAE